MENNNKWVDWEGNIIITENGKNNTLIGRNDHYKQVIINNGNIREKVKIKIKKAHTYYLEGLPIQL